MSDNKRNLTKNIAAGAMLVALSGFVPHVTRTARAASASISVTGSFTSGLAMTAGTGLQFGKIVGTAVSGKVTIKTGGGVSTSKGFFNATPKAGSIAFSAGASKKVDITVTGMKTDLTLVATANGGNTGTVTLTDVKVAGPFAVKTYTTADTTDTSVTLTDKTADLAIGGTIAWKDPIPLGAFSETITVTISF